MAEKTKKPGAKKETVKKGSKQKWSLKKKLWVIGGSIVGVIILLVILVNAATSAPVVVSNDLVTDIQTKNSAAAYSLFSSAAKQVVTQEKLTAAIDRIGPILSGKPDMKSKEVKGETGSAASAKVVYDIKGTDGVTYKFTVNLVKDNGDWKVLNFDSEKK
jgi:ABC-type transporter MlaC component